MNNKKIFFRFAVKEDLEDVFNWRNDEITRKYSFNSSELNLDEHKTWYFSSLKNPNRNIFIALDEHNAKIGQIRFDRQDNFAIISIVIAPQFRGQGYGTLTIINSCEFYFNNLDVDFLVAKIKSENKASINVFEKAGFEFFSDNDGQLEYRLKK